MDTNQDVESIVLDLTHRASASLQKLAAECTEMALRPGWRSRRVESDMNGLVWHFNHPAPTPREGASVEQTLEQTPPYQTWMELWRIIRSTIGHEQMRLYRAYVNAYPFGAEALTHNDGLEADKVTVLVPAHTSWHHDWGGETVLLDSRGEVARSVLPYPGRALVFRARTLHSARPVTRSCPLLRTMLVLKAGGYPTRAPLRARQPDMLTREPNIGTASEDPRLWQALAEDEEAHVAAAMQWLLASKAAWETHGTGSLAGHLVATGAWLKAWGASRDVIMGGLCHALFGTDVYRRKTFDLDSDRNMLEQVFGRRGLRLGAIMGASERVWINALATETREGKTPEWPMPIRSAPNMTGPRYLQTMKIESEDEWRAIMLIAAANECAQLGRWDKVEQSLRLCATARRRDMKVPESA